MTNRLTKDHILLFLLIIPMSSISNDRPFERDALIYHEKLMQGKFEELESDARYARATNATITDGQPLLSVIYGWVSGCEDLGCSFPDNLPAWEEKEKMLKNG